MIPADCQDTFRVDYGAVIPWQLPHDGPDWAAILTAQSTLALAVFTFVLMLGVIIAATQLLQDRRFRQVQETGELFNALERTRFRTLLDKIDKDYGTQDNLSERERLEIGRKRTYRLYQKIKSLARHPKNARTFRHLADEAEEAIKDVARITERIEIYIRRGVASGSLVAEHLAYDIVVMYYFLQDTLQERAREEDLNYEGFRDLALRVQEHSQLYPLDAELRDDLKYAELPPLCYRGGDSSLGYDRSPLLRARLWWHLLRNFRTIHSTRS